LEAAAAAELSFEVINAGKFDVRLGRLIVTAILVEPRNGIRTNPAIRRRVIEWDVRSTGWGN
jgi:hypothetical protein